MITVSNHLIIPEDQEDNRKKMTAQITKRKVTMRTLFCVTLPTTSDGLLEVLPVYALRLEAKEHDITVLGVCEGRKNALSLVEKMIGDVYRETGAFDMKAFYMKQ